MRNFLLINLFAAIILMPTSAFADDELGYFYNEDLREILSRPYTFAFENKAFPFPIDEHVKVESILIWKQGYQMEIENPYYCFEKSGKFELCGITEPVTKNKSLAKAGKISLNETSSKEWLKELSSKVSKKPRNGKIEFNQDQGKAVIISESKNGYELDVDESFESFKESLFKTPKETVIKLSVKNIEPEINTDNIEQYGIIELVGKGESNFSGSPKNRIHNINVALERFQGYLLKPREEFSFTTLLGEVDEDHGYKEELVIKNNETIPEFGGGVCQVSTTMFRTALNSGLDITERHNHAYPVAYYNPQGTDATIYVPKPDLRFINDTGNFIFINTKVEGYKLTIEFYGTSDGRQVELDGPHVIEKTPDNKMKTILTQIIKDKDGEVIRKKTFKSFYDDPAKYHQDELITEKPDDWSKKQWKDYKDQHGM